MIRDDVATTSATSPGNNSRKQGDSAGFQARAIFMGEEKPDEELMGKRKSSPRFSSASSGADILSITVSGKFIHREEKNAQIFGNPNPAPRIRRPPGPRAGAEPAPEAAGKPAARAAYEKPGDLC
jgi:hypothetical protein